MLSEKKEGGEKKTGKEKGKLAKAKTGGNLCDRECHPPVSARIRGGG